MGKATWRLGLQDPLVTQKIILLKTYFRILLQNITSTLLTFQVLATGVMATRQPMLELPFWTDSKESQPEIVLIEGMQESKPTYRDWNYDILYPDTPTSRLCIPSMGPFAKVPCRRVTAYTKQVPRYHRHTKNIPSKLKGQVQSSHKAWIKKNCEWY